jgi:manganese/iron transport system ATP-binding protein
MFAKFSPVPPPIARHGLDMPSVTLQNVSVRYGNVYALEGVDLALPRGAQVAIVGPNGAGKSTLFNVIAGITRPTQGRVNIYGSEPAGHICVGYVPQRNRVNWHFPVTVADVVLMGRTRKIGLFRRAGRADHASVQEALARVRLTELANRQIGELSGGQQQRVFLARALAQEAELLLLDEPLTGLDLPSQELLLQLLAELRERGITILVATHDLNQAAADFSTVLLLNRRVIAMGAPATVLTTDLLRQAYGSHLHVVPGGGGDLIVADSCCDGGTPPVDYGAVDEAESPALATFF